MGVAATRTGVILVLTAMALGGNWLRAHEPAAGGPVDVAAVLPGSVLADEPMQAGFLDMLGARSVSFRSFQARDGATVWVFLGYFSRQKEGSQVHSPRHCYPGSGWSIVQAGKIDAPWGGQAPRLVVSDGTERRMVMYWYQTPAGIVDGALALKRHLTARVLSGRAPEVVFARVSTRVAGSEDAAAQRLQEFAGEVHEQLADLYAGREQTR